MSSHAIYLSHPLPPSPTLSYPLLSPLPPTPLSTLTPSLLLLPPRQRVSSYQHNFTLPNTHSHPLPPPTTLFSPPTFSHPLLPSVTFFLGNVCLQLEFLGHFAAPSAPHRSLSVRYLPPNTHHINTSYQDILSTHPIISYHTSIHVCQVPYTAPHILPAHPPNPLSLSFSCSPYSSYYTLTPLNPPSYFLSCSPYSSSSNMMENSGGQPTPINYAHHIQLPPSVMINPAHQNTLLLLSKTRSYTMSTHPTDPPYQPTP